MIADGRRLSALAPNIVVKLPICAEALAATHQLASEGVRVNMTLVFSATQALLAANAGARYISPFVGRFDDIAEDGISQLADVTQRSTVRGLHRQLRLVGQGTWTTKWRSSPPPCARPTT